MVVMDKPGRDEVFQVTTRHKGDDDGSRVEQLECVVSLRLTPSDHAEWLAKVKASGQTRSEFFRSCVLGNRTEVIAKTPASADKMLLLYLYNKSSNNINQIAHSANLAYYNGVLDEALFVELLREIRAISRMLKQGLENVD